MSSAISLRSELIDTCVTLPRLLKKPNPMPTSTLTIKTRMRITPVVIIRMPLAIFTIKTEILSRKQTTRSTPTMVDAQLMPMNMSRLKLSMWKRMIQAVLLSFL